ncbi:hypothetical protein WR164_14530 [Philodulcilactobacillus myokoensis]|uniref:Uncharacterized protein n=1 Tax=Philodulcilactobacillus myokoensis TaxID=2929573 RepID=A0A9W6B4M8_9LACO|nr:hypothetical protein WR164_14530 [Philodulcilactobacillus myokoensis]
MENRKNNVLAPLLFFSLVPLSELVFYFLSDDSFLLQISDRLHITETNILVQLF